MTPSRPGFPPPDRAVPGVHAEHGRPEARTVPSLAAPAIGLGGAIGAALVGGWLMLAPFALGSQPPDTGWTDATHTEFYTGLGVAVLAVFAGLVFTSQIVTPLRLPGAPRRPSRSPLQRDDPDTPEPAAARPVSPASAQSLTPRSTVSASEPPATASGAEYEVAAMLRPLVQALIHDLATAGRAVAEIEHIGQQPTRPHHGYPETRT